MTTVEALLVVVPVLVACGRPPEKPAASAAAQPSAPAPDSGSAPPWTVAGVWVHYGTEAPSFCLVLDSVGRGRFISGFVWLNPVQWTFSAESALLRLQMPRLTSSDASVLQQEVRTGRLFGFDSATKTLSYKLNRTNPAFDFAGWPLERPEKMQDWEYGYARRGCPQLLPARPSR